MSDLISFAECYVQHGAEDEPMLTEKCPARTKPHTAVHVNGPMRTHWEIYTVGRWRRLFSDNGHFVRVDRKRVPVKVVRSPPHWEMLQQAAMKARP